MTDVAPVSAVVLPPQAIAALPEVPLDPSVEGVTHRVLWRNDTSMAGVMSVAAAHHLGVHAHRHNHHHLWVLEGEAEILGVGPHLRAASVVPFDPVDGTVVCG